MAYVVNDEELGTDEQGFLLAPDYRDEVPGTIAQAHKPDEHISIAEYTECIEHLIAFIMQWCGQAGESGQPSPGARLRI